MNQATISIKKLRENFIKRNQINPDFFIFTEDNSDEEEFLPASARAKINSFPIKNTPLLPNTDRGHSQVRRYSLASLHRPFMSDSKIDNPEPKGISIKGNAIFTQAKISQGIYLKRNLSSRQRSWQHNSPNVKQIKLSQCNTEAMKIENRPRSAFSSVKSISRAISRIGSWKKNIKLRKKSEHLKPWEVDDEQIYTCWV